MPMTIAYRSGFRGGFTPEGPGGVTAGVVTTKPRVFAETKSFVCIAAKSAERSTQTGGYLYLAAGRLGDVVLEERDEVGLRGGFVEQPSALSGIERGERGWQRRVLRERVACGGDRNSEGRRRQRAAHAHQRRRRRPSAPSTRPSSVNVTTPFAEAGEVAQPKPPPSSDPCSLEGSPPEEAADVSSASR
jgi:hypothetical protein